MTAPQFLSEDYIEYLVRLPGHEVGGQRTVTVRKYSTTILYNREDILEGLTRSRLVFGNDFGVLRTYDHNKPDRNIRALFGLIGTRTLPILNNQTNNMDYLRVKNVIVATVMLEFVSDPDDGFLGLLIYGGRAARTELWQLLKSDFAFHTDPLPRTFNSVAVRSLCNRFFNRLFEITIDPWLQDGWGTISAADFKAKRGRFIDNEVDRMRQIQDNPSIVIQSFASELRSLPFEGLQEVIDVKFSLLKDGGVNLEIPQMEISPGARDLDYEDMIYDVASQIYSQIVGDEPLYEAINRDIATQLSLFGGD